MFFEEQGWEKEEKDEKSFFFKSNFKWCCHTGLFTIRLKKWQGLTETITLWSTCLWFELLHWQVFVLLEEKDNVFIHRPLNWGENTHTHREDKKSQDLYTLSSSSLHNTTSVTNAHVSQPANSFERKRNIYILLCTYPNTVWMTGWISTATYLNLPAPGQICCGEAFAPARG